MIMNYLRIPMQGFASVLKLCGLGRGVVVDERLRVPGCSQMIYSSNCIKNCLNLKRLIS